MPVGSGIVLILGGLAIGWLPGPGGFIAIFGVALLATEFRFLARLLDWSELRLIGLWRRLWVRRSKPIRILVVVAALMVVAGAAWAASRIVT